MTLIKLKLSHKEAKKQK